MVEVITHAFAARGAGPGAAHAPSARGNAPDFRVLTARELEVLDLLALGETTRKLGRRLGISERTVRAHCYNIVRKLYLESRLQATIVSSLYANEIRAALGGPGQHAVPGPEHSRVPRPRSGRDRLPS